MDGSLFSLTGTIALRTKEKSTTGEKTQTHHEAVINELSAMINQFPNHHEIKQALADWLQYRASIKKPYKNPIQQLKILIEQLGSKLPTAVQFSIAQGYQGCFLPRNPEHQTNQITTKQLNPIIHLIATICPDYLLWINKLPTNIQTTHINFVQQSLQHLDHQTIQDSLNSILANGSIKRWSDLPFMIQNSAKQIQLNSTNANNSTNQLPFCQACKNSGYVLIKSSRTPHHNPQSPLPAATYCFCHIGQTKKSYASKKFAPMATFNPNYHEPLD